MKKKVSMKKRRRERERERLGEIEMPYLENEKKVFRIGKKQWKKRGLVKISEGIEEDTGCGYSEAVSPNPTTRFLRIA